MARRKSSINSAALGVLILIGVPIAIVAKMTDSFGGLGTTLIFAGLVSLLIFYRMRKRAARIAYLRVKYGDENIVQNILQHRFWHGQTAEQLRDSLSDPVAIDDALLKTRTRHVWKYHPNGKNRYRLRITVENGIVTGWDQKN